MKQRIKYIDRLKGFTIILVVMGHLYLFSMDNSDCIEFSVIGSFHMYLFMFLSGLMSAKGAMSPYTSYKYTLRKLKSFLMPMFVFGILFTMTFGNIDSLHDFLSVVINFVNAPAKNGYWYLMSLSVFYVSLQFFRLNRRSRWGGDLLISTSILLLFFILWKFTAQENDPFCLLNCANFYFFFIMGVFFTKYSLIEKVMNNNCLFTVGLIGYIVLFCCTFPIHTIQSLVKHIILPLCALLAIIPLFLKRENHTSIIESQLEYIGQNTIDIYVLHYFFLTNLNLKVTDQWLHSNDNLLLLVLMTFFISLVVTYLCIFTAKILHQSTFVEKIVYGKK